MAEHYVKNFSTSDHLISILFLTFIYCTHLQKALANRTVVQTTQAKLPTKIFPCKQ